MTIKTYPEMNAKITELLRWDTGNPLMAYAAQRIEELEAATAHLERLEAASRRMLTRALHENRVRDECLGIAIVTLRKIWWEHNPSKQCWCTAADAIIEINKRLAELEPEGDAE